MAHSVYDYVAPVHDYRQVVLPLKVYTLLEVMMFAVTGLLMVPLGLMTISSETAFAGWTSKANTDKPKNNNTIIMIEAILFKLSALFPVIAA